MGGRRPRCCCLRRRRRSRRRTARSGGVLAKRLCGGARAASTLPWPTFFSTPGATLRPSQKRELTRVTAFRLPKPDAEPSGGPRSRARLLDAPARAARAVKNRLAQSLEHEHVTWKRRGTRRAVAVAVLHRRRGGHGARRAAPAGVASGPSVRRRAASAALLPAAAARPRRAPGSDASRRSCAHWHRARLLTHEFF